jgi:hypothetical protein
VTQNVDHPAPVRRRPWRIAIPLIGVLILAAAWSGFWFYAASRAATAIAGWRDREALGGRIHTCGAQQIGGYPFRIEVRCIDATTDFPTLDPPLRLAARDSLIVAQAYDPTLLIGEFNGPLTLAQAGHPISMQANWSLARASVRGTAAAPERVSVVIDKPEFARISRGAMETVATATHVELHGRVAAGTVNDNPAIEIALQFAGASAPALHPALARPSDGEVSAVLFGLKDFAPKPWSARWRELAAAGGRIEIAQARLAQGDILAVGAGSLALTPAGRLDGQINLTVAGLDRLVGLLGIDQMVAQYLARQGGGTSMDKIASGLDRILPGLGGAVRNNSGAIAAAGIAALGEPRDLEGRKAVSLPLRFSDGAIFLGPLPIGRAPPLF